MKPCEQCPWRLANQGKKHKYGFYTKANLRRLWNQIRGGGKPQSCHLTDPSHPDHRAVGAKDGAKAQECPGSVILVWREIRAASDSANTVTPESIKRYQVTRKKGLTKSGIVYWIISRLQYGGVPFLGSPKLPAVTAEELDNPEVGLPEALRG